MLHVAAALSDTLILESLIQRGAVVNATDYHGQSALHVACQRGRQGAAVSTIRFLRAGCRAMKTKGMVFRYTWVYSKEDTMAHTRRLMVTS